MKHKRFDEIFPYTYYVRHKQTGIKYYGVRWANVKENRTPADDFCKIYFTSIRTSQFSWFKAALEANIEDFEYRIHYTFDSPAEALEYEMSITKRIYRRKDWANMGSGKAIDNSRRTPEEMAATKQKRILAMQGKNTGPRPEWVREIMKLNRPTWSGEDHPRYGAILSTETKAQIADSLTKYFAAHPGILSGKNNPMYGKHRVYIAISPQGETFRIDAGISSFCRERNLPPECAKRCADGKQRQTKGWKFHYEQTEVNDLS